MWPLVLSRLHQQRITCCMMDRLGDIIEFAAAPVPPDRWRFGQFEIDLSTGELRRKRLRIHIQDQPLRILGALLERAGEVRVTREELRARLWPSETFVTSSAVSTQRWPELRQALADSAEQPRYIETIARRGYRFVAPVEASPPLPKPVELEVYPAAFKADASVPPRERERWVSPAAAAILLLLVSAGFYLLKRRPFRLRQDGRGEFGWSHRGGRPSMRHRRYRRTADKVALFAVDASGHGALWVRTLSSEAAHAWTTRTER